MRHSRISLIPSPDYRCLDLPGCYEIKRSMLAHCTNCGSPTHLRWECPYPGAPLAKKGGVLQIPLSPKEAKDRLLKVAQSWPPEGEHGLIPPGAPSPPEPKRPGPGEVCPTCGRKTPGRKRLFESASQRVKAHREGERYWKRKGKTK